MNVLTTSANCTVINSGLVTSFDGSPITIALLNSDNTKYQITFQFEKDESAKDHRLAATPQSNGILFTLINFNNPLGTGTAKPINFASDGTGKKLFINFSVYTIGEANPTLHYTIYKEN